ncbi:peptide transporter family 1 isoform X2 [Agrilus planipennis]|uniref:Oligopeptide transporter 1 n=1 Tax=Agrilus planipennis TaxID=224129 RepID=A0A7F5RL55_AGRPL|nr:peptide transporter family 1 isoform X2 [Agrilus planipennis]
MGLPSHKTKKLPYPKSVFFIVTNEFCERFCFYGMRTILSLYLTDILLYSESTATVIYHTFVVLVYFFPIIGAMIADSFLGKFRTIVYLSCVYATGNALLALTAAPPLNFPLRTMTLIGLLLIAVGSGGIKPCVSAFGGDQFTLPYQASQLSKFFSVFYFSINFGSFISTFVTPILREDVKCFGDDSCYSLAFAVPGVLMVISIVVFVAGKPFYKIKPPEGNVVLKVSKCIGNAIVTRMKTKERNREHWLDYAKEKYDSQLIQDIKDTLRVLVLFLPLPVFWALYDQQGTGWTFMARRMDGYIGFYTILPDQMQVVNSILILGFIPLFDYVIYPALDKCRILTKPLQRLTTGGIFAAAAFAISAVIALFIEQTYPQLPSAGNAQLRIYNVLPCDIRLTSPNLNNGQTIFIKSLESYTNIDLSVTRSATYNYMVDSTCSSVSGSFQLTEKTAAGYYFNELNGAARYFEDDVSKSTNGYPSVRTLFNSADSLPVTFTDSGGVERLSIGSSNSSLFSLSPDTYKVRIGSTFSQDVTLSLGGVYSLLALVNSPSSITLNLIEVTRPNSVHMLLLIPQYIIITAGEIMFSITGLEFAYSQAPTSMKSVLTAGWLLTTAFGNVIVIIIQAIEIFEEQSKTFFLYTGIMLLDMIIFALMATRYKYVNRSDSDSEEIDLPIKTNGVENATYMNEEKQK